MQPRPEIRILGGQTPDFHLEFFLTVQSEVMAFIPSILPRPLLLLAVLSLSGAALAQGQSDPPSAPQLREGVVLRLRFLPEAANLGDRDLTARGRASTVLVEGERGRYEGKEAFLTLLEEPSAAAGEADAGAEDYLIIDSGEPITRNWLEPGVIWGFHTILLLDSVDRNDFETFIHRYWSPTRSDALPDSKMIFLKKLSGTDAGEFSYIWLIDSEETRDYYFPESKVPSRMYTEFEKGWDWLNGPDHLGKYLAAPEDELFTDFVVVR